MSETNKTYRIRTVADVTESDGYLTIDANLAQDYDTFDVLSLKISSVDTYKLHNANYGVIAGRVLANNGFGIPNAKISIFISSDSEDGEKMRTLYPFTSMSSTGTDGVRYNLLPDEQVSDCHQIVGTFPNKRYALDNDAILEVFDKYYKYTTRTNNSGDYLIMGVPTGAQTLHMDLDLSDCGILSQRPRDFVYKGYTIEQFENPNMFKTGTTLSTLSQIFTQDRVVNVRPFWGNNGNGDTIGITRADIDVAFKFEPTCVFMGSVVSDNASHGITKKCMATEGMGLMDELTTGEGTIEMIRKTPGGSTEEFQIKGTQLINGDGVWCYQIPMNLDYMMTDEYGNMVPTDDPEKGIPTRTRVRFRISMQDNEENTDNFFRAKVLVPHNPQNLPNNKHEEYDYEFGTYTRDDSFRDLFWNNVYSVKSYIPRFQKRQVLGWNDKRFTGIKGVNYFGSNNPFPYNNLRIKLPLMFRLICAILKSFIYVTSIINSIVTYVAYVFSGMRFFIGAQSLRKQAREMRLNVLMGDMCPDLENWYFAPIGKKHAQLIRNDSMDREYNLLEQTITGLGYSIKEDGADPVSIDYQQQDTDGAVCLSVKTDYFISCIEMNLAMEYRVINFDFYNDWVNGTIYIPRFMRYIRPKKTFLGITFAKTKTKGCMDDTRIYSNTRKYTQQCSMGYKPTNREDRVFYSTVSLVSGKSIISRRNIAYLNNSMHKKDGFIQGIIFGKNGGVCHGQTTSKGQYVYYMKPCEWTNGGGSTRYGSKANLFATDIILLGSLNDCDMHGVPMAFKHLSSTSYIMPTNLALTNMETNGPLYATPGQTICRSGNNYLTQSEESKIELATASKITNELNYYNVNDNSADVKYAFNELTDIIPLTEAAGISWNYTGPGQGDADGTKLYYPGGHFLGLSCLKSQTNIKSCINLQRICELGVSMSQRKEDVSKVDSNGNITYTYTTPSGFISADEIVDDDFRTMFSTMNHKRLIATKINPDTGYKTYDFDFIKPINFDGAFKGIVTDGKDKYNTSISLSQETEEDLKKYNIASGNGREDFDPNEYVNTQTRTIEDSNIDYYCFRLGLDYNDLTQNNSNQLRKFLASNGTTMYLPQYENSFYFYFGLHGGATAIEEFNKQFFSECNTTSLIVGTPTVGVEVTNSIDICSGTADVRISTNNMETPYQSISWFNTDNPNNITTIDNSTENGTLRANLNRLSFTLNRIKFGNYKFTIVDANGTQIQKDISIGMNLISFESVAHDFNVLDETSLVSQDEFTGGYIEVKNVAIINGRVNSGTLVLKENGNIINSATTAISNFSAGETPSVNIYMKKANTEYKLYLRYSCSISTGQQELYLGTFSVKNGSGVYLTIGSKSGRQFIYSGDLKNKVPRGLFWYDDISGNTENDWLLRKYLFKENGTGETFSSNVTANGGAKALWGSPQNQEGALSTVIFSGDYEAIPEGYSVDDESTYWPTIGLAYNSHEKPKNYSALAYNGLTVGGNYCATMERSSSSTITIKYIDKQEFIKDAGYVFKPLDGDGELEFHIYDGKDLVVDNTTATKGLFYPSFVYPVVHRQFFASMSFFIWSKRTVELVTNSFGTETAAIDNIEVGLKTEGNIHNGITYNNMFGIDTVIDGINDKETLEELGLSSLSIETGGKNDLYGLSSYQDRIIELSGITANERTEVSAYGYTITENTPINGKYSDLITTISDSVDSDFANYITCTKTDSKISLNITSSDTASYYICEQTSSGPQLIETGGYIYDKKKQSQHWDTCSYHILCQYTSAATNNNTGENLIAKIEVANGAWTCVYSIVNGGGFNERRSHTGLTLAKENDELIRHVFKDIAEITPVISRTLSTDKSINWGSAIKVMSKSSTSCLYNSDNIYFAVGMIKGNSERTTLYKIYPMLVEGATTENSIKVPISVEPTELIFTYNDNMGQYATVGGAFSLDWEKENFPEWITIRKFVDRDVNITVEENKSREERFYNIIFYDAANKENKATLLVTQLGNENAEE